MTEELRCVAIVAFQETTESFTTADITTFLAMLVVLDQAIVEPLVTSLNVVTSEIIPAGESQ